MLNYTKILVVFVSLLVPASLFSQTLKALEKKGDEAVANKDYYTAMIHFAEALTIEPQSMRLNYKYGEMALQFKAFDEALDRFEKVLDSNEAADFPLIQFHLGQLYRSQGQYNKAIDAYETFLSEYQVSGDDSFKAQAIHARDACKWARESPTRERVEVIHFDKEINTPYSEFAPVLVGDTLYYSSYRYEMKSDKHDPKRKIAKVLLSVDGKKGMPLRRGFNPVDQNTAHTAFSLDGKRVYFTLCDYLEGSSEIQCKLFYRELDSKGSWKGSPKSMPAHINRPGFTTTQPNVGYDSTLQAEVLFFVSDHVNGVGGLDIWYAVVEESGFSKPELLDGPNTEYNEISPYFHTPTQTLYFSSEGYENLGGYDIFMARKDSMQYVDIENMLAPINTSYNDVYYMPADPDRLAYLASNRPGSFYLDRRNKACCNDIYEIHFLPADETPLVSNPEIPIPITPPDLPKEPTTLEDFLPLALYFDNDEPDKRTRKTTTKRAYQETFEPYYERKDEYISEYSLPLDPDDQAEAELNMDLFFEEDIQKGSRHLGLFSEILLARLEEGEEIEIFLKGFTSPRAETKYNEALGKRRISSVRNHFQTWRDGIFQPYLDSGNLIISERSFGEATAAAGVSDSLEDLRNSVYSIDAARERRVEIVEVKRQ
ncbi:MAG: hypothetical protein KDC34_12825 [Saprospiraceae bacterium]|nr:hypothetical protein [Saprospiraceae bacterium]